MTENIQNRVVTTLLQLADHSEGEGTVALDTPLNGMGFDSIRLVQLVIELEKEFAMSIPSDKIQRKNFDTAGDVIDLVKSCL